MRGTLTFMKAVASSSKFPKQALLVAAAALVTACAGPSQSQTNSSEPDYTKKLDPWRCTNYATPLAIKGDQDALRACFLSAYVRVNDPMLGGEDLEQMCMNFSTLLTSLGDAKFARALMSCRPEIRAATGWFLEDSAVFARSPLTRRAVSSAPSIDWPIAKALRATSPQ